MIDFTIWVWWSALVGGIVPQGMCLWTHLAIGLDRFGTILGHPEYRPPRTFTRCDTFGQAFAFALIVLSFLEPCHALSGEYGMCPINAASSAYHVYGCFVALRGLPACAGFAGHFRC